MDENKEPDIKIVVSFVKQIIQGLRAFHRQDIMLSSIIIMYLDICIV
jgi:hypothetical protein